MRVGRVPAAFFESLRSGGQNPSRRRQDVKNILFHVEHSIRKKPDDRATVRLFRMSSRCFFASRRRLLPCPSGSAQRFERGVDVADDGDGTGADLLGDALRLRVDERVNGVGVPERADLERVFDDSRRVGADAELEVKRFPRFVFFQEFLAAPPRASLRLRRTRRRSAGSWSSACRISGKEGSASRARASSASPPRAVRGGRRRRWRTPAPVPSSAPFPGCRR